MLLVSCSSIASHRIATKPVAQAFAFATRPLTHRSTRQLSSGLFSEQGGTSSSSSKAQQPLTGWGHKLPPQDSPFWNDESPSQEKVTQSSSGGDGDNEPRTGWLHNTQPKKSSSQQNSVPGETPAQRLLRLEKAQKMRNHRIVSTPAFFPCGEGRRVVVTEHKISVPTNRDTEEEEEDRVDVFFRIVELVETSEHEQFFSTTLRQQFNLPTERANAYVEHAAMTNANHMILYLQGGPGFGAPAPVLGLGLSEKSSWASEALSKGYKRIVLMDQRGTGKSTPITKQTLEKRFPDLFALDELDKQTLSIDSVSPSIAEQLDAWEESNPDLSSRVGVAIGHAVEYMTYFRADNIVRDAEEIRDVLLLPPSQDMETVPRPWGAALGQSFGGFCMMTYLSQVSNPPQICLFTGGIAPMLTPVDEAYDALWDRIKERNLRYYDAYPDDVALVKRIVNRLSNSEQPVILPSGGHLTPRRFLQLGIALGGSPSAFASLHALFSSALLDPTEPDDASLEFTRAFLKEVDSAQSFEEAPLYFLLHESIYADGSNTSRSATEWSAHRMLETRTKTPNEFSYPLTSQLDSDARPVLMYGEMVFPWMAYGDFAELSGFGMRALSQSLATKDDWGPLYDAQHMRQTLASGTSKAAAAVYYDDMYVDFNACMKVTARGGPLEHAKVWITNDYQHSGLRDDGATIFTKLLGMAKGSVGTPS